MPASTTKGHYRCPRCRRAWEARGLGGQQVCLRCLADVRFGPEVLL